MCEAFSCVVTKNKVYWQTGIDSHSDLIKKFKLKDDKIGNIVPVEITPRNKNYLSPDKWIFKTDLDKNQELPDWWKQKHERCCWEEFKQWKKEVYSIMDVKKLKAIKNPFKNIKPPKEITKQHIKWLREWVSVKDSVGYSVGASVRVSVGYSVEDYIEDSTWVSVGYSVGDFVRDSVLVSVKDSVWVSVKDSVEDSIYAQIGNCFRIKKWECTEKIKLRGYPFKSAVKLWNVGLVPVFDGEDWMLLGGKDAKILFRISKDKVKR
ncbi:MAG: hypothetical protein ACTSXD_08425 [Candidatus Heimdallarchaeaceae archaeon]